MSLFDVLIVVNDIFTSIFYSQEFRKYMIGSRNSSARKQ